MNGTFWFLVAIALTASGLALLFMSGASHAKRDEEKRNREAYERERSAKPWEV
jgi:hypothetical protein